MTTATTSRAARASIAPHIGEQRARLLKLIAAAGSAGVTDLEAQAALSMPGDTERPRRGELLAMGMIADSGITRPSPKGREATAWVATISGICWSGESL